MRLIILYIYDLFIFYHIFYYITLHCIILYYITFYYITLHYISFENVRYSIYSRTTIYLQYFIVTKNKNKDSSSLISLSSFRLLFGRGFGHVKGHPSPAIQGLGRNSIPLPTVKMPKMAVQRGNHGEMAFQWHFNGNSISIKIEILTIELYQWAIFQSQVRLASSDPHPDTLFRHSFWYLFWHCI